jgi:hypothetical protein
VEPSTKSNKLYKKSNASTVRECYHILVLKVA